MLGSVFRLLMMIDARSIKLFLCLFVIVALLGLLTGTMNYDFDSVFRGVYGNGFQFLFVSPSIFKLWFIQQNCGVKVL